MSAYRIYVAQYPFVARDNTELSMSPGDQLIVEKCEDGSWPNASAWMRGKNDFIVFIILVDINIQLGMFSGMYNS